MESVIKQLDYGSLLEAKIWLEPVKTSFEILKKAPKSIRNGPKSCLGGSFGACSMFLGLWKAPRSIFHEIVGGF